MKITPYLDGVTIILVIAAELVSICNGKPQFHGHEHANTLVRLVEKPTATYSNSHLQRIGKEPTPRSTVAVGTTHLWAGPLDVPPTFTKAPPGNGFRYGDYSLLDATSDTKLSTNVELALQAELKSLEPQNPLIAFPSRRRFRTYSTRAHDDELATGAEQASSPDGTRLAASSCKQSRLSSTLPRS